MIVKHAIASSHVGAMTKDQFWKYAILAIQKQIEREPPESGTLVAVGGFSVWQADGLWTCTAPLFFDGVPK